MSLILASGSPRRRTLLKELGVPFEVRPSAGEERPARPGEDPAAYALSLAVAKAQEIAAKSPDDVVLGADTVVTINGAILGKPRDAEHALTMLQSLAGREHTVVTGVAVARGDIRAGTVSARVTMRTASEAELRAYIATGEPMDKAGAYAVQEWGGNLVEAVKDCYYTVVGLPLCLCRDLLVLSGVALPAPFICRH